MLTNFQRQKLVRSFRLYDQNKNGYIERQDFIQLAERLAQIRGWVEGTASYELLMGKLLADWDMLASFADVSGDYRIGLDEWLAYNDQMKHLSVRYRAGEDAIINTVFDIIDRNGDGQVTLDDFKHLYCAYGLPVDMAEDVFDYIDVNGDGVLTRTELLRLYYEFAYSEDPDAPGNWLFGNL